MMRIVFIILLFFSSTLLAQNGMSVAVGANYSTFRGTDKAEALLGFSAGINYQWQLTDKFNLRSGVYYSQEGSKLKQVELQPHIIVPKLWANFIVSKTDIIAKIGYINLPIHIIYQMEFFPNNHTNIIFGSSIQYAMLDYTKMENTRFSFHWRYRGTINYDFDYKSGNGESHFFKNYLNYSIDFGIEQHYGSYFLQFIYGLQMHDFGAVGNIVNIHNSLSKININLGFHL